MLLGPEERYKVKGHLGDGTFGRVLAAKDQKTGARVALKVIKSAEHLRELAAEEAEVLWRIQKVDFPKLPDELRYLSDLARSALFVRLLDSFLQPDGHFCMVFEELGMSLRDLLKRNHNCGLYLADVQAISRQLVAALAMLHLSGFIHTDLKCRNVMLRHSSFFLAPSMREPGLEIMRPRDCSISLIDFGGCVQQSDSFRGCAGTRQFRSPELVLGLHWDTPVDLWAAGCIVYMLYFGKRPFSVHENMEHLAMMERLTGSRLPPWMLQMARECQDEEASSEFFFTEDNKLVWPDDPDRLGRVQAVQPLSAQVPPHHSSFLDFLRGLFQLEPLQRVHAFQAPQEFLTGEVHEGCQWTPEIGRAHV